MKNSIDVSQLIYFIRNTRVMLGNDLARLYQISTKALVQAVKRNRERFPSDFMFQLSKKEFDNLKSQIVTSSWGGLRRANPYAFSEQGVAMLTSVLRSPRAVRANIAIMRAFVKTRAFAAQNHEILKKLSMLEGRVNRHDSEIGELIDAIRGAIETDHEPSEKIGFKP
ncbi:MAG: DNA-binding protein [Elusimicrobia bacterium]|nr:MAG: DNA-binding protein [Elusimicrobiota bacterium]